MEYSLFQVDTISPTDNRVWRGQGAYLSVLALWESGYILKYPEQHKIKTKESVDGHNELWKDLIIEERA